MLQRCLLVAACLLRCLALADRTRQQHLGIQPDGRPTCVNGVWTQASEAELMGFARRPDVQCWRSPPCIKSQYLHPELCQRWKHDDDWPTWYPHAEVPPGTPTAGQIIRDFLRDRTIIFVGDSVNSLVYQAFVCEAAKEDIMPEVDDSNPGLLERLSALQRMVKSVPTEEWVGGSVVEWHGFPATGTIMARKGWHHWGHRDMELLMETADVLVVNYALHYESDNGGPEWRTYKELIGQMLSQVETFAKTPGKAFVWRETAMEHEFYYARSEEEKLPEEEQFTGCRCHTSNEKLRGVGGRVEAVAEVLRAHPEVPVVQMFNLTLPARDMHEGIWCSWDVMRHEASRGNLPPDADRTPLCCDCTHYCYTPQMWRIVFGDLYRALDSVPGLRANG